MIEKLVEKKVCDYAKRHGWLVYKFTSPSHRGVPDRILLMNGCAVFIEFKSYGRLTTKLQNATISKIRAANFRVLVIDDVETGKQCVDELTTWAKQKRATQ